MLLGEQGHQSVSVACPELLVRKSVVGTRTWTGALGLRGQATRPYTAMRHSSIMVYITLMHDFYSWQYAICMTFMYDIMYDIHAWHSCVTYYTIYMIDIYMHVLKPMNSGGIIVTRNRNNVFFWSSTLHVHHHGYLTNNIIHINFEKIIDMSWTDVSRPVGLYRY